MDWCMCICILHVLCEFLFYMCKGVLICLFSNMYNQSCNSMGVYVIRMCVYVSSPSFVAHQQATRASFPICIINHVLSVCQYDASFRLCIIINHVIVWVFMCVYVSSPSSFVAHQQTMRASFSSSWNFPRINSS